MKEKSMTYSESITTLEQRILQSCLMAQHVLNTSWDQDLKTRAVFIIIIIAVFNIMWDGNPVPSVSLAAGISPAVGQDNSTVHLQTHPGVAPAWALPPIPACGTARHRELLRQAARQGESNICVLGCPEQTSWGNGQNGCSVSLPNSLRLFHSCCSLGG